MKMGTAIFPGWLFPFVYCVAGVDAYYKNGTVTQEHLPTGQEAVELGCDLWNIDPEEFLSESQEPGMGMT